MNDLNDPKVTQFTPEIAAKLGLDSTFVDFVFAPKRPRSFECWCEDANGAWTCFVPENVDIAYPLWSTNGDQTLLLVTGGEISYAKGWHDNSDIEMISKTSQGLLANLVNEIWESDVSEKEMRKAAQFCGFKYLKEFLAFANRPDDDDDWDQRWQQLIAGIDRKEHQTNG